MDKEELELRLLRAKDFVTEAQTFPSKYANNNRTLIEFQVDDYIVLSAENIRASFRAEHTHNFQKRLLGPFKVTQRIGLIVYRLNLPPALSRIHKVFYVCLLKPYT